MDFGQRLKTWRKARRMTQVRLAELARTTQGTVSRVERGGIEATAPLESALIRAVGLSSKGFWSQTPGARR